MNEILAIPKDINKAYGAEYAVLRSAGLKHIERLANRIWTDYNTHDPGVTILELLCWVITDLGYRISLPVEDLLASEKNNLQNMHEQFLSALHILPTAPVTANDYRKLFIRIDGVKNAWMLKASQGVIADFGKQPPQLRYALEGETPLPNRELKFELNGLYNILLDIEESHKDQLPGLIKKVKTVYHHFRNICEDLVEVKEVPTQEIVVCAGVELEPKTDPEETWAAIMYAIEEYLSPDVNFYNLGELHDKQRKTDEIFDGPVFDFKTIPFTDDENINENIFSKKGFIDDEEIRNSTLRKEVRLSDLIRIITNIQGVKLLKSISFGFCGCQETDENTISNALNKNNWLLCVKEGFKPVLCLNNSVINFYKDVIPIELKTLEAKILLQKARDEREINQESKVVEDLPMPLGNYRNVKAYHTIQNHFPETYGIGQVGLPETATVKRKALAKQLKAYLLFFDQVLANYFSQLSSVKILLSAEESVRKTYFHNMVMGVKDVKDIFKDVDDWETSVDSLVDQVHLDNYIERKNKFLDHLLARFAEQFNEYVFLLHRIYGVNSDYAIIRQKLNFYKDYENMSAYRADGSITSTKNVQPEERINVSGMEKRLSRLLGFNHYQRQQLSALAYKIFRIDPADSLSPYSWTIQKTGADILKGTELSIKQVDAYEEMGTASILGCDRENYLTILSDDKLKVSLQIVTTEKQTVAFSTTDFAVLPGEAEQGVFSNAENAITDLTEYFCNEFRLEGMYVVEHILSQASSRLCH